MSVEVLLLSQDDALLQLIRRVCEEAGISLELASDAPEASDMLARRRFDGLIVDCDAVPDASGVIVDLRKGSSNRSAVVFLIRNGTGLTVRSAFEMGANFVLDKPVTAERATRCFRAAQGLLARERRRYFRVPVDILVDFTLRDGSTVCATIANLSEGGISIRGELALPEQAKVKISFRLPGHSKKIEAKGEVAWTLAPNDRSGVQFTYMSDETQRELAMWLNAELQRVDPVLLLNANRGCLKEHDSN